VNYNVGNQPQSVVVADFNGDSKSDLVVVDSVGNSISVLLGLGDGTFRPAVDYPVGNFPLYAVAGDFNGDGRLDLAIVPNRNASNVGIMIGNGDGTFQPPVNYPVGANPYAIAVGDFNGDGESDLAVSNAGGNNVSILLGIAVPDLTVSVTHVGNFTQGQAGQYYVTVNNSGSAPSFGTVTVVDTLPVGLTATAISGTGWSCTLATLTCTRGDPVKGFFTSFPQITLTVNVAGNAAASLTNTATLSGGGPLNTGNETVSDATTVIQVADLTVTKTHTGNFTQGQAGAAYSLAVSNIGLAPTVGTVTAIDSLPAGLTASAIGGTGWTCLLATLTCTRSDALAVGASYSTIIVTVNVSSTAPPSLTNTVTVSGGGESNITNDTATDPTVVGPAPAINAGGVVTGANYAAQLAPGMIATLFGTNLSSGTAVASGVPLPTSLGGVSVSANGTLVPLFFVSPTQINFQVPWELLGAQASIVVMANGSASTAQPVSLHTASPGIFSLDSSGSGQGAIQIANTTLFAATAGSVPPGAVGRPVNLGESLTIYCSGLGYVSPQPATGAAAPSSQLSNTQLVVTATIGGASSPVTFAGLSPGFVGLYQVNVQVPNAAPAGTHVPVVITVGGVISNTVTIAVQ